jgi:predicted transcriptional regulator
LAEKKPRAPWQVKRLYTANLKAAFEAEAALESFMNLLVFTRKYYPEENRMLWAGADEHWRVISAFHDRFWHVMDDIRLATERRREAARRAYFHERMAEEAEERSDWYAARVHRLQASHYEELRTMNGRELQALFARAVRLAREFEARVKPEILLMISSVPPWASQEVVQYINRLKAFLGQYPDLMEQTEHLSNRELEEMAKTPSGQELTDETLAKIKELEAKFNELSEAQTALMQEIERLKKEMENLLAVQRMQIAQGFLGLAAQTAVVINNLQAQINDAYSELSRLQEETAKVWEELQKLRR